MESSVDKRPPPPKSGSLPSPKDPPPQEAEDKALRKKAREADRDRARGIEPGLSDQWESSQPNPPIPNPLIGAVEHFGAVAHLSDSEFGTKLDGHKKSDYCIVLGQRFLCDSCLDF